MATRGLLDILSDFISNPPGSIGVAVIHLAHATEREPMISALEEALQHPLERFNAIDGVAAIAAGHPTTCATDPGKIRTAGEIGCLLSHVELARKALLQGRTHMLVFEDDCAAEPSFSLATFDAYLRRVKEFSAEFDIEGADDFILLGTCGCYRWKFLTAGVKATNKFNGSHCYLIGRQMMEKLIGSYEYLLKHGTLIPVDGLLGHIVCAQMRWALCPEDEKGLFVQNRELPSYVLGCIRKE